MPSMAAAIARVTGNPGASFRVDYSTELDNSCTLGRRRTERASSASKIAGKDVLIGTTRNSSEIDIGCPGTAVPEVSTFMPSALRR